MDSSFPGYGYGYGYGYVTNLQSPLSEPRAYPTHAARWGFLWQMSCVSLPVLAPSYPPGRSHPLPHVLLLPAYSPGRLLQLQ